MATAMRKLDGGPNAQSWLVRNEQGETFGPVDFDTLKSWACDGRLAPTNEVSENGGSWALATSLGALEMDWVAEVTPGTFYGPIHRLAMDELVRDGSISSTCSRFLRRLAAEPAVSPAPDAGPARDQEGDSVRARLAVLEDRLKDAEQRADRQRAVYEEQIASAQQQHAGCIAELEFARASAKALDERAVRAEQRADAETERGARQQAALEEQLLLARQQSASCAAEAARAREAAAAHEVRAAQSEDRASALDGQLRAALDSQAASASELQVALGRVAVLEEGLERERHAQAEQAGHAQRLAAAYEEQLQLLRRQVSEHVGESARAQARAEALEVRLREAESEAEQRGAELKLLRDSQAAAASKAVELKVERDAQATAFEAERLEHRAAMSHAQAEVAVRTARLAQLEKALEGHAASVPELGALEEQVRVLGAEVAGLRQALGCEKEVSLQAQARCTSLEKALDEARARCGQMEHFGELRDEMRRVSRHLETLSGQVAAVHAAAAASVAAERPAQRVDAEPVDVEVLPPDCDDRGVARGARKATGSAQEAKAPAGGAATGPVRTPAGMSLAELEKQARRELERLGAQGANLFRKK